VIALVTVVATAAPDTPQTSDSLSAVSASDIVAALLILLSAFLSLAAGVGIIRFPDVLTRLHAATKPQVLGLAAILLAIVLEVPTWGVLTTALLIMTFQLLTQPMTAHMLGRSAYRTDHVRRDLLIGDELARDIGARERENERP
jgi:multicomponent Na+:H+ antiporter subunit G